MKIDLPDNLALTILDPSGPSDYLTLAVVSTDGPLDRVVRSISLDANQAAALIYELKRAFACFAD